ncbi:MAG: PAS domain S-box protein [Rhodoferax sp.]|nr:PAS domain S-box protein [Rhodoferax sp.]
MFPFGMASHGSFKRQIILTFVVGFFVLATTFAVYLVRSERASLYRDSGNATTGLAQSLAVSSLSWVLANDVVGLQEVVQSFRDYPELRYAMIISPTGRVMAHSDAAKVGQFLADEQSLALVKTALASRVLRDDAFVSDVAVPIAMGKRHVGWARIGLGREGVAENLRKMIWNVTFFVLLATALSLLAAALVVYRLGRRIGSLVTVAKEVQAGNFATRVAGIHGNDEIVRLADSLNLMLDELSHNEKKLRASSLYTRSLIEASLDPLVTISPDGKITDVNLATETATGRSRDELVGTDFSNYFTEPAKARAGYQQVFAQGTVTDYQLAIRHRDGHSTAVLYNASVYRNEAGEVQGVLAAARDISAQQRAALVKAQLAAIVESSSDAIIGKSLDGTIISWNKGAEMIYGYPAAEIIGQPVTKLAAPALHAEISRLLKNVCDGDVVINDVTQRIRKDGTPIHVALTLSPIRDALGHISGVSTIARDITERMRADEMLRQNETRYRTLIQNIQAAVVVHGADTQIVVSNSMAQDILGLSEDQLLGKMSIDPAWHFFCEDGKVARLDEYPVNRVLASHHALRDVVLGVHRPGQENDVWVLVNADPVFGKDGSIIQVIVTFIDITQRKQVEENLKRMNERFSLAARAARLGVWDWNLQKNELVWDDRMYELYGVKREDFAGAYEAWRQGIHPDDREASDEISKQAQRGEREYDTEFRVVWPDGSIHCLKAYGQFVRDADGKPLRMTGINFDITQLKLAEEELRTSEQRFRMAQAIGHIGNWEYNVKTTQFWGSDEAKRIYGFDPARSDFSTEEVEKCIADQERVHQALVDLIERSQPYDLEFEILPRGTSAPKIISSVAEVKRDENGNPEVVMGVIQDITTRKLAQQALRRSEHGLAEAQRVAHLGNWELDLVKNELTWSDEIFRIFEIDQNKFGATYEAFLNAIHPEDRDMVNKAYTDSLKSKVPYDIEHRLLMPDGRVKYINEKCETYYGAEGKPSHSFGTVHDITDRILDQQSLLQLNRELRAISNCNQILLRSENEQSLLAGICRIVCDEAGYCMAWVGYPENDEAKTIRPIAWSGVEEGYLAQDGMTWADTERGRGPCGVALRSGQSAAIQDFDTDPTAAPWRDAALRLGYRSNLALPLKDESAKTFGTLAIYSTTPNAFTPDEMRLLEELAGDLSFGIVALRTRAERKQAEEALQASEVRYSSLFRILSSGVVVTDDAGQIVDANPAAEHILGLTRSEAVERTFDSPAWSIVRPDGTPMPADEYASVRAMHEGRTVDNVEMGILQPDGTLRWLLTAASPVLAKRLGVCIIFTDITERKREQTELERYRDHLEHLVQERTVELQAARDTAEAANRAKSVFLSNMSHELRTPLNAILGFAELMEHDDAIAQPQKRNLATINRSGRHLLTLINDILDLSKIEAGRLTTQSQACDLHELIETIAEAMELRARQKGLELNLHVADDLPRFISTDPGKLRQILINLLSNAVKFTVHGGIDLDVSAADWDRQSTRLTLIVVVRDTGVGMTDDELSHIFQPFYQAEHGIRSGEGTGLGLTIARQFAQLLGGGLTAASMVDKGSAFTLRLPVDVAETMVALPPHRRVVALAQGQAQRRILVVEDKEDNQLLLTQLLQQVGLETRIAANGKEALDAFEAWHPHFIWMDMRMPVMDGYEATRRIRALPGGHEVKIAALTASAFREDRGAILAAGCDDVLSKPLDEEQLFSAMERLLGLHYRYAEPSTVSVAAPASGADLTRLPTDLRQELSRAAQTLDEESTQRAIERVRAIDARLAGELEEWARDYRYDRIVTLCEGAQGLP